MTFVEKYLYMASVYTSVFRVKYPLNLTLMVYDLLYYIYNV